MSSLFVRRLENTLHRTNKLLSACIGKIESCKISKEEWTKSRTARRTTSEKLFNKRTKLISKVIETGFQS